MVLLMMKPIFMSLRAFLLYQRQPYDRTTWSKLRDPWYFILMCLASSPVIWVRGLFMSILLACIAIELEEYQLQVGPKSIARLSTEPARVSTADIERPCLLPQRYILTLKGTQFISGLINLTLLIFDMWSCLTLHDVCDLSSFGMPTSPVAQQVAVLVWIQLLCWTACVLGPFSSRFDSRVGALISAQQHHPPYVTARRSFKKRSLSAKRWLHCLTHGRRRSSHSSNEKVHQFALPSPIFGSVPLPSCHT